ncbi:MAG: RNA-directed DNA polymerase [Sphingomicrobium sp.]
MLSEPSVERAISHVSKVGDTDLFPALPEFQFFTENAQETAVAIMNLGVGSYNPVGAVEVLTPKSNLAFRICHQLTAPDILIYTAAVIEAAPGIQSLRDRVSGEIPFSYKYDPDGGHLIFAKNRGYHDWLGSLSRLGESSPFKDAEPVLETDISDFYQRIYSHRIDNLLANVSAPNRSGDAIKKIISAARSKQSHGIPVGSSASRLLAEGLLTDTNKILIDLELPASRYVDDYRIVANEQHSTHSILCRLAEHLMTTEGLSLNPAKTRVVTTKDIRVQVDKRLTDVFTTAEFRQLRALIDDIYDEQHDDDDVDTVVASNPFISGENILDRLDELKSRGGDNSARRALLKSFSAVRDFDVKRLLRDHNELAYFLPRDFAKAIIYASSENGWNGAEISETVWLLLNTAPISELPYARLWLLHLYARGVIPADQRLVQLNLRNMSPLEERQLILIRHRLNDRAYFRQARGHLGQLGEWAKPALLIGALCLPVDEYSNWIDSVVPQLAHPMARPFCQWLKGRPDFDTLLAG